MNPLLDEPGRWSRGRWWAMIAIVLLVQVGLIFALGDRKPVAPRAATETQRLLVQPERGEMLALQDPTLFALPNANGFGAAAWLRSARLEFSVFRLPEPKQARLELSEESLGATFQHFVETNTFASIALEAKLPLEAGEIEVPATDNPVVTNSTLQVGGELAKRPLQSAIGLPPRRGAALSGRIVGHVLLETDG